MPQIEESKFYFLNADMSLINDVYFIKGITDDKTRKDLRLYQNELFIKKPELERLGPRHGVTIYRPGIMSDGLRGAIGGVPLFCKLLENRQYEIDNLNGKSLARLYELEDDLTDLGTVFSNCRLTTANLYKNILKIRELMASK